MKKAWPVLVFTIVGGALAGWYLSSTRREAPAEYPASGGEGRSRISSVNTEDMGRLAATAMTDSGELTVLAGVPPAARTPEHRRRMLQLEQQRAALLGTLPDIAAYENNPDDYSRFFTSLLRQAAGLDEEQTARVSAYMRTRGVAIIAEGLNAGKKPVDVTQMQTWKQRRHAFIKDTITGVKDLLPPGILERVGFTADFVELLERDFPQSVE